MGNYCVARPKTVAPCRPSTAVLHARNLQVAAKSESAADVLAEDVEPLQQYVAGDTLEVEAAAVADESLKIVNCNLSPSTVQALEKKGIHALFPIQKSVFDPAMAGQDLVARARTGSGKTLAFALPIIESILKEDLENGGARPRAPRALILAPTRELAKQVASELQSATNSQVRVLTVYGGTPLYSQIRQLNNGIDVLVGTPGRTIDLCQKRGELDLSAVRFFVLDEADEMLNMGFQEDVETVLESVPENRQTMMFSATMPQWVRKLAKKYATNHIMVDLVGEHDTGRVNSDVKCLACTTPPSLHAKRFLLVDLITLYSKAGKTIVFCNTKRECEAVVTAVSGIMPAEALHGDIAQDMREYTMNRFREGKTHVLVATDVAARGLDVNNVDLVVHWDVPSDSETYLHRSGRTGRAGNKGTAIVLIGQHDKGRVADIMRDVKVELELIGPPSPEQIIASAADNIKRSLSGTSIEVARFFEGTAKELLENGVGHAKEPAEVLATVMAQMSGYTELPKVKSLLGQQEGYVTLGVLTPKKMGFTSPGALIGAIRRITSDKVSGSIGKVELFDDIEDSGYEAAFDVPKEHAAAVIEASKENGAKVDELKSLPLDLKKLRNHRGGGDRGGRGGRWGGRGGGRGRGGGGGYNRDRSNNRGSYGSRGGGGYGGGGSYMDSRGGGGGYRGRSDGGGYNDRRQGGGYSRGYSSNSNRGGRSNYRDNDGGGYRGGNDSGYGGWGNSGGGGSKRREINTKRDFDSW